MPADKANAATVSRQITTQHDQSINHFLLTHDKTHMLTPGNTQLQHRKVSTSF